jgi:hypothetical protein
VRSRSPGLRPANPHKTDSAGWTSIIKPTHTGRESKPDIADSVITMSSKAPRSGYHLLRFKTVLSFQINSFCNAFLSGYATCMIRAMHDSYIETLVCRTASCYMLPTLFYSIFNFPITKFCVVMASRLEIDTLSGTHV